MAKKPVVTVNKFAVKKAQLEILEKFNSVLEDMKKEATTEYRCVGKEEEQARDWKTDELKWEDEEKTIPYYRNKYEDVELTEEEMTDSQKAMVEAIRQMTEILEGLL